MPWHLLLPSSPSVRRISALRTAGDGRRGDSLAASFVTGLAVCVHRSRVATHFPTHTLLSTHLHWLASGGAVASRGCISWRRAHTWRLRGRGAAAQTGNDWGRGYGRPPNGTRRDRRCPIKKRKKRCWRGEAGRVSGQDLDVSSQRAGHTLPEVAGGGEQRAGGGRRAGLGLFFSFFRARFSALPGRIVFLRPG